MCQTKPFCRLELSHLRRLGPNYLVKGGLDVVLPTATDGVSS